MKLNEAKAALEVPGFSQGLDDDALHAHLARANLMRLRGDFAEAEEVCVMALTAYPDSAAVHTLLGDIAYSQDQFDKAVEHYEIAFQLDDKAPDIPRKLEEARRLTQAREAVTTAEQLGLPSKPALPWTSIGFGAIAALALGGAIVAALAAYPRTPSTRGTAPAIVATADTLSQNEKPKEKETASTPSATSTTPTNAPATEAPAAPPQPSVPPMVAATLDDQSLLSQVQTRATLGGRLLSVTTDPRTHSAVLTFTAGPEQDPKMVGADLARATLDQDGNVLTVTVRGVRDEKLIYVADVPRTLYDDVITEEWQRNNPDPAAWVNHVVTNEWPVRTTESAPKTP